MNQVASVGNDQPQNSSAAASAASDQGPSHMAGQRFLTPMNQFGLNSNLITPGGFIGISEAKESQELETPKNAIVGKKFMKKQNFNRPQLENLEEENQDDHDSPIDRKKEGDRSPLASDNRHQPQSYKNKDEGLLVQQSA